MKIIVWFFFAACASTTATRTGTTEYGALTEADPVALYMNEREVPAAFEVVGVVERNDPGKWQQLNTRDAFPHLRNAARSLGANGVIVDETKTIYSGVASRGVWAKGRAIRVVDK